MKAPLDRTLYRQLRSFMRPHRKLLGWGVLLLAVGFAVDMTGFYLIRLTIDGPVRTALELTQDQRDPYLKEVRTLGLFFLAVVLFAGLLRYLQTTSLTLAGQRITYDIRRSLFEHLLHLKMRFFDRRPVGELVTRVTSDVENLFELFSAGVVNLIFDLVKIVGVLGILFALDARLTLLTLAALPVFAIIAFRFRVRARSSYRETRKVLARANAFLQESVAGMRVTQLSVQEPRMQERFAEHGHKLFRAWMETVRHFSLLWPVVDLVTQALLVTTFCVGGWLILETQLEVGAFLQFWLCLRYVVEPIRDLAERYNVLQSALSSTERIARILGEEIEPSGQQQVELQGKIEFDRITFAYGEDAAALQDLSFQVTPGQTVAVVGATGAGKSTLTRLLLKFYRSQHGTIRVDGVEVGDWSLADLRRGIGVVPQDVFLFADSIVENIRLHDHGIPESAVQEACERAGAGPLLRRLPNGLHTLLGERGINLSAGERQLLAFARVLVHDPRILVLDEATSSVDSETESLLQEAIEQVLRGRTCLVIAHRLSTIRLADRILVLHQGQLREAGTHEELLDEGGIYSRLHALQFGSR